MEQSTRLGSHQLLKVLALLSVAVSGVLCGYPAAFYEEGESSDILPLNESSNGDLRLAGNGSTAMAGRLEIYVNTADTGSTDDEEGEWGTVSGNKFSMTEAHVACRQLGFYSASHWNYSIDAGFDQGEGTIFLSNLRCSNSHQQHLLRCKHSGIGSGTYINKHVQDVAVFCNSNPSWYRPYKGQVRLVNSNLTHTSSGRVEVYQKSQWGSVCSSALSTAGADSVCRQLGYTSSLARGVSEEPGYGVIWVGEVNCQSSQKCFTSCFKAHKHTYNCNHTADAAVQCTFDFSVKRSAGNKSACKITGFPVSQLIFYVFGGIALLVVLATIVVVITALSFKLRRKCSRNYMELQ